MTLQATGLQSVQWRCCRFQDWFGILFPNFSSKESLMHPDNYLIFSKSLVISLIFNSAFFLFFDVIASLTQCCR